MLRKCLNVFIIILINLTYIELSSISPICSDLKTSNEIKSHYATKTGYFNVDKGQNLINNFLNKTSKCTTEVVWFISRHGSRYPIEEDYKAFAVLPNIVIDIEKNFKAGHGCLQRDDVDKYTGWISPCEERHMGQLTPEGAEELFSIGEHWRALFPNIFGIPYNPKKIQVQFTISNRTSQSAYHFLRGMYGDDAVGQIDLPKPKNPDYKLRFHKICPAWMKNVYRSKNTYVEQRLFEKSHFFKTTLHAVSSRLGFTVPLSKEYLLAMYDECRYETSWFPNTASIWCKPFTEYDLKVLEFFQDLKYYYEDSYGTPMNIGMACETMTDLLTKLRYGLSKNPNKRKSSLYFSHDKVMLHFFSSLGLFRPTNHLRHSDFEPSDNRVFNTSYITPFASNLGFSLIKCEDEYKVGTFFQGVPIYMKHICSELLCDWSLFENYIRHFTSTCNFSKTCDVHDEL